MNYITSFRGENAFLSNFYPIELHAGGFVFNSVEAAFQAQKNPSEAHRFVGLSPAEAKQLGRTVKLRPNWNIQRVDIMQRLVAAKFTAPELRAKLLATDDALLVEGNTWGDEFWGVCNGAGLNMLGKILMKIRDDLQKGAPSA